jgi:hypothetical protein
VDRQENGEAQPGQVFGEELPSHAPLLLRQPATPPA